MEPRSIVAPGGSRCERVRWIGSAESGLFDDDLNEKHASSPLLAHAEEKAALLDAKDLIAEKFGDHSLRFGHEIASREANDTQLIEQPY